jgi:hypothetical protein
MKLACDVCGSPIEGTRELLPGSNWLYVAKWIKCARPICCALFRAVVGANAAEGGGVNSRVGAEEGTRRELARIRSRLPSARLRARHVLSAAACPLPSFQEHVPTQASGQSSRWPTAHERYARSAVANEHTTELGEPPLEGTAGHSPSVT